MTKVLVTYLVEIYLFDCSSRIKQYDNMLVFKLKAFDSKVSFVQHTLTVIFVILSLDFNVSVVVRVNIKRLVTPYCLGWLFY